MQIDVSGVAYVLTILLALFSGIIFAFACKPVFRELKYPVGWAVGTWVLSAYLTTKVSAVDIRSLSPNESGVLLFLIWSGILLVSGLAIGIGSGQMKAGRVVLSAIGLLADLVTILWFVATLTS